MLALLHICIARQLRWKEEATRMSAANASIFHVHALFICLVLVLMGLPSMLSPSALLEHSALGRWTATSWAVFWLFRLYCQWFVYPAALWKGKPKETVIHLAVTLLWVGLATLYGAVALWQFEWYP